MRKICWMGGILPPEVSVGVSSCTILGNAGKE